MASHRGKQQSAFLPSILDHRGLEPAPDVAKSHAPAPSKKRPAAPVSPPGVTKVT